MIEKKVLIVDDAEIDREVLTIVLTEENDCDFLMASSSKEAISMVKRYAEDIGVILLDLEMNGKEGYSVMKFLRQYNYLETIPVLIICEEDSLELGKRCLNWGASDFLRKPFDNELVRRRVENVEELYRYRNMLRRETLLQEGIVEDTVELDATYEDSEEA